MIVKSKVAVITGGGTGIGKQTDSQFQGSHETRCVGHCFRLGFLTRFVSALTSSMRFW